MNDDPRPAPVNPMRRKVLQMIAATGAAATVSTYSIQGLGAPAIATGVRYGVDPDLLNPKVTWGKSLAREHLLALQILGDIIIPADEHSPKASDLNIADFVNEWVSAPYPEQQADRRTLLAGLKWLD